MAAQPEPLQYVRMEARPEPPTLSIRPLIARELQQAAVEHGRTLAPLTDEIKRLESGLDSPDLRNSRLGRIRSAPLDPVVEVRRVLARTRQVRRRIAT